MLITIASTRAPKVNGVKNAARLLAERFTAGAETLRFETLDAQSGVADTPVSIEEMMTGARHRAASVFHTVPDERSLSAGVEGGLFRLNGSVFLQSWTCIFDGSQFHFGSSGALPIPDRLARMVLEEGTDLGTAIDTFARQTDVRSRQGTYGILTNDIITRESSFELSASCALMPFFNGSVYDEVTSR